jgi:monomeric isocitrate dehydrogenase
MMNLWSNYFWCYRRSFLATEKKYSTLFTELNIDTRNGLGDVYAKIKVILNKTEVENIHYCKQLKMVRV